MIQPSIDMRPADAAPTAPRFDYATIAPGHRERVMRAAEAIHAAEHVVSTHVFVVGKELNEAKKRLEHGQFGEWLRAEFDMSERTAERMMAVARRLGDKSDTVSVFSDSVLYMLAAPSTPDAVIERVVVEFNETGVSPTRPEIKAIRDAHKPPPTPPPATTVYTGQKPDPELSLPDHLLDAGYALEQIKDGRWRWRHKWPTGYLHVGNIVDTPALAIEEALINYRQQRGYGNIPADPEPDPLPMTTREEPASDLTPPDLAAAGYTILQVGDVWGWERRGDHEIHDYKQFPLNKVITSYVGGKPFGDAQTAIDEARRDMLAGIKFGPHRDYYPEKGGPAVMPADLVAAGYVLDDQGGAGKQGWFWRFGDECGPNVAYGGAAIEGARAHYNATRQQPASTLDLPARDWDDPEPDIPSAEELAAVEQTHAERAQEDDERAARERGRAMSTGDLTVHHLVTVSPDSALFKAALINATFEQLAAAMHRIDSKADPMRFVKIGNRREILLLAQEDQRRIDEHVAAIRAAAGQIEAVEAAPQAPDPRLAKATRLRNLLHETRAAVNADYGELCGKYTDGLAFFRGCEAMIASLDSLIEILTPQEQSV